MNHQISQQLFIEETSRSQDIKSKDSSTHYRSICAIKCDGRDDLCEGYADERDCEQLSWVFAVLSTIIVISVIITLYWCLDVHFPSWFKLHRPVVHPAKQDSSLQLEVLANPACVADVRQKQFRAPILHNTIFRSRFLEPADMQQVCLCLFEHELKCQSHPLIGEVEVLHRREHGRFVANAYLET